MKGHGKTLAGFLALCVFLAACTSSGSDASTPEATSTVESVTAEPTATPTSEPVETAEVSNDDLIAAALAAYEADPQPEGTIAWDVLDSSVFEDVVSFTMCTWDGLTANDVIRDVKFATTVDADGTIAARNVQSSPTSGDCLNTQLIESAIATANFQEEFWESVALAPATFADSDIPAQLFTDFGFANFQTLANQWIADDVIVRGTRSGSIPEDLKAPLLWRAYRDDNDQSLFELVSCRPMDSEHGIYRGDLLLDDLKANSIEGPHRIDLYRLFPDKETDLGWRVDGTDGFIWSDCFNTGDWLGGVAEWMPEPARWQLIET